MSTFDERYPNARTLTGRPGWPPDVRSISLEGVDYIGVDDHGRLYWDGHRIEIARTLSLTRAQNFIAVLGVLAAVAVGAVESLRFFGYGVK